MHLSIRKSSENITTITFITSHTLTYVAPHKKIIIIKATCSFAGLRYHPPLNVCNVINVMNVMAEERKSKPVEKPIEASERKSYLPACWTPFFDGERKQGGI